MSRRETPEFKISGPESVGPRGTERRGGGDGSKGHIYICRYVVTRSPCRRNSPFNLSTTPPRKASDEFRHRCEQHCTSITLSLGDPRGHGLEMPDSGIHVSARLA